MKAMDRQHLETPFCGSSWLKAWLGSLGRWVGLKRVRQLVRTADPERDIPASPRQPGAAGVRVYPDLLSNARVARSDPVRAADITYLTMTSGVPA